MAGECLASDCTHGGKYAWRSKGRVPVASVQLLIGTREVWLSFFMTRYLKSPSAIARCGKPRAGCY